MSSLKSHFRHTHQQYDAAERTSKPPSRIPTKAAATEDGKSVRGTQNNSKLAKKSYRNIVSPEHSASKRTAKSATPVQPAPQGSATATRRTSMGPLTTALPVPPQSVRTPSLVSGSSASTFDSPRSALRRRPSGMIDRFAAQRNAVDTEALGFEKRMVPSRNDANGDMFDQTILGISIPPTSTYESQTPSSDLEQELYDRHIIRDFTPPVANAYAQSTTSSSRYTDSPFSHVPTPSSASSYSPGAVVTAVEHGAPRQRLSGSPAKSRPPLSHRSVSTDEPSRLGLSSVRESSTSSSNSTVRADGKAVSDASVPLPKGYGTLPARTAGLHRHPSQVRGSKDPSRQSRSGQPVPPELAHLNVDNEPPRAPMYKSPPPVRPSRDGTPNLSDMNHPSPVVQSDLPRLFTTYHKRQPSVESPAPGSSSSARTRFGFSRSASRNESPRIDSALSPPPSAQNFQRGPTPEIPRKEHVKLRRKDSPALPVAQSPSKSSRFGLFSRKAKSDPPKTLEKPRRQPTKGPVAGTGHEGYGRFGVRGRTGSVASSSGMSSGIRSPSTDSSASNPPQRRTMRKSSTGNKDDVQLDDFLRERLNPVYLRGSGSSLGNTASSSDLPGNSLYATSSKASSLESVSQPLLLPSAIPQSRTSSPVKRPVLGRRAVSDSSEDDSSPRYPSIAARRSLHRLSSNDGKSPVRVPAPIKTGLQAQHASVDSYDAEMSAWPQTDSTLPPADDVFLEGEGHWLRSPQSGNSSITGRKWNFFERAISSPRVKGKARMADRQQTPETSVHQAPYGTVPHYALLGPVEPIDLDEVERIAHENETSADDSMSESQNAYSRVVPYEKRHVSLLPSPPKTQHRKASTSGAEASAPRITVQRQISVEAPELAHTQSALAHPGAPVVENPRPSVDASNSLDVASGWSDQLEPALSTPDPSAQRDVFGTPERPNASSRQSRLSPVGRIPPVVSRRDRDRKLPANSFSRPFARTQPRPSVKPPGSVYSQIRDMASPIESGSQPVSSASTGSEINSTEPKSSTYTDLSTNRTSLDGYVDSEFLAFPRRKDSEQSNSTASWNHSWMAALHAQPPQQEDVWKEYDDFMDEVLPGKTPTTIKTPTTGSSLGAPFQYSSMLNDSYLSPWTPHAAIGQPPSAQLPSLPTVNVASTVLSVPQQISRFLQPSLSPMTPDTISGFIGGYGNRSTSTLFLPDRTSTSGQQRASFQTPVGLGFSAPRDSLTSSRSSRGSAHSRLASLLDANGKLSEYSMTPGALTGREAPPIDIAEAPSHGTPASRSLRYGALMTSKWLSFGRVLFSPAHNEIQLADERRVLVVDGLSSDWGWYLALSYPEAEVYNLTPSMPGSPSFAWPAANERPPANHRQIPLSTIATPFPFPRGFFTAVVFRFPAATTEEMYAACISECKRVLRPGGFLEIAVLDLDLMNMGTKARRAVRGLKTRMQSHDPEVCLRNLSDILVYLIGRRGFEGVQRCMVGVPAAGRIPRSQDMSSVSSGSSGKAAWQREARSTKSQEFSFADLLEDARGNQFGPGKNNDESITKMVAKVGRWWYSTCYEKALLPGDQSIWSDPTLLRECEKQGTSFRLLICHAQKPSQTRRRTVSV